MEVSAINYSGGIGLHGRSRLLRLQSDERLVGFLRKGNTAAFEVLLSRYESRLHAFCRHLLGSREDAEDVMQEVMAAAFNALQADDRPVNVRPWLYRIARNRSLNHLRRIQSIGVDSMDVHFSDHGASTADKVHEREEFRLLVGDIHELPETQKTALVLREMDALSYEQIAEAMETTVSSVKSLLVRARVSLAEASEARLLSCNEVRVHLGEVSEGLRRRPSPLVRRHLRQCKRCTVFRAQLKHTNKALAALLPIGPTMALKQLMFAHLSHSAASSSGAAAGSSASGAGAAGAGGAGAAGAAGAGAAGAGAAGAGAAGAGVAGTAVAGSSVMAGGGGFISAGVGALAAKAAAGLAAAALVTGAAVEANPGAGTRATHHATSTMAPQTLAEAAPAAPRAPLGPRAERRSPVQTRANRSSTSKTRGTASARAAKAAAEAAKTAKTAKAAKTTKPDSMVTKVAAKPVAAKPVATRPVATVNTPVNLKATPTGRTQNQSDPTVLPPGAPTVVGPGSGITLGGAPEGGGPTSPGATTPPGGTTTPPGGPTTPPAGTPMPPGGTTDPPGGVPSGDPTPLPGGTTEPPGGSPLPPDGSSPPPDGSPPPPGDSPPPPAGSPPPPEAITTPPGGSGTGSPPPGEGASSGGAGSSAGSDMRIGFQTGIHRALVIRRVVRTGSPR